MLKTFFTYEQQLNKLQQEKGLVVPDIATATETLEHLSYYSLIGGYKQLFKHTPSQKYKYRVTFDELNDDIVHTVVLQKLAMSVAGGVPCVGSTFYFPNNTYRSCQ